MRKKYASVIQFAAAGARRSKGYRSYDKGAVLVIDDDLDTRAATSELLADLGFWPMTMRNGLEALEYLRLGAKPMAILVDLYMPLMDGEAFCAACDADPRLRQIPRVLISANPQGESRATVCRVKAFLKKPVASPELEQLLRALPLEPA